MKCLGCEKEYKLLNKHMGIVSDHPNQEVELTYISCLNAIYFYCIDCRKDVKENGVDDDYLAEYLKYQQIHEVLSTLPSSSQRKTLEVVEMAQQVVEEREIHADAMKTMDNWYRREYKELKEDWSRKNLRIIELEEENRTLKRQLEVKVQIQEIQIPKVRSLKLPSLSNYFSNLLTVVVLFGGIQNR